MKVTYYVPTSPDEQEELRATVKRLFNVDSAVTERATGVDFDFSTMDSFADLLNIQPSQVIHQPHVKFTIEPSTNYTPEQIEILTRPGTEHISEIDV